MKPEHIKSLKPRVQNADASIMTDLFETPSDHVEEIAADGGIWGLLWNVAFWVGVVVIATVTFVAVSI